MGTDMRLVKYADAARRTAIYPMKQFIVYPTLGLAGETAELIDKMWECEPPDQIQKEMGDCLWYTANLAIDCDIKMHTIIPGCETFGDIEAQMLPSGKRFTRLLRPVGAICELVKKLHRDDDGKLSPDRREKIRQRLAEVLWRLAAIAKVREWSLGDIARENTVKLKSRQQRGVLTGDGDNR